MGTDYTYPLIVDTVGKLSTGNYVSITCQEGVCRYNSRLDLMAIVRERGPDYSLDTLHAALYCPYCRQARRPDRNLHWSMGHDGRRDTEFLADVYQRTIENK